MLVAPSLQRLCVQENERERGNERLPVQTTSTKEGAMKAPRRALALNSKSTEIRYFFNPSGTHTRYKTSSNVV